MREFFREVTASQERANDRAKEALFVAWNTGKYVAMARSKKGLPALKDEYKKLGDVRPLVPQSPKVMRAMLQLIGLKEQRVDG